MLTYNLKVMEKVMYLYCSSMSASEHSPPPTGVLVIVVRVRGVFSIDISNAIEKQNLLLFWNYAMFHLDIYECN